MRLTFFDTTDKHVNVMNPISEVDELNNERNCFCFVFLIQAIEDFVENNACFSVKFIFLSGNIVRTVLIEVGP